MRNKIANLLCEIRPEFDFSKSEDFIREGLLDSFDIVQLVAALDEEYHISIDGTDILPENFHDIDGIVEVLHKNGV